jgi:hypothetical protein
MAISYVTSTTYTSNAAASGTITKTTTQTNDLMIAFLAIEDSNLSGVVNTLAGWNPIGNSGYASVSSTCFALHPLGIRSPWSIDVSDAVAPIPQV